MTAQPHERSNGRTLLPAGASDVELMQAVAAGDKRAFAELHSRYGGAVAHVCRVVRRGEGEDCEQEVFARVWRKATLFDPARGSVAAWLLTLARRTALNLRATGRPAHSLFEEPLDVDDAGPVNVDGLWLDAALARLSARERGVVELAYYHDLSESAIARRLRVPVGSVKSWKRRGLNRLAELLAEEAP